MDVQKLTEKDEAQEKAILNLDEIMLKIEQVYYEMQSNMTKIANDMSDKFVDFESTSQQRLSPMQIQIDNFAPIVDSKVRSIELLEHQITKKTDAALQKCVEGLKADEERLVAIEK